MTDDDAKVRKEVAEDLRKFLRLSALLRPERETIEGIVAILDPPPPEPERKMRYYAPPNWREHKARLTLAIDAQDYPGDVEVTITPVAEPERRHECRTCRGGV